MKKITALAVLQGLFVCLLAFMVAVSPVIGQLDYQPVDDFPPDKDRPHKGDYFQKGFFQVALREALISAHQWLNTLGSDASGYIYPFSGWADVTGDSGSGTWSILLADTSGDDIWGNDDLRVFKQPAIIENLGDGFRVSFLALHVPDRFMPEVEAKLEKERQDLASKHKDIHYNFGVEDGQPGFVATFSYAGGVTSRDLDARLEHLFKGALKHHKIVLKEKTNLLEKERNRLRDESPMMLTEDDFVILFETDLT